MKKENTYELVFEIRKEITSKNQIDAQDKFMEELIKDLQGRDPATLMDRYCKLISRVGGMVNRLNTVTKTDPRMDYITSDDEGEEPEPVLVEPNPKKEYIEKITGEATEV